MRVGDQPVDAPAAARLARRAAVIAAIPLLIAATQARADTPCGSIKPQSRSATGLWIGGAERISFGGSSSRLLERRGAGWAYEACWVRTLEPFAARLAIPLDDQEQAELLDALARLELDGLPPRISGDDPVTRFDLLLWRPGQRVKILAEGVRPRELRPPPPQPKRRGKAPKDEPEIGPDDRVSGLLFLLQELERRHADQIRLEMIADRAFGPADGITLLPELARREVQLLADPGPLAWTDVLSLARYRNTEIIEHLVALGRRRGSPVAGAARAALHHVEENDDGELEVPPGLAPLADHLIGFSAIGFDDGGQVWAVGRGSKQALTVDRSTAAPSDPPVAIAVRLGLAREPGAAVWATADGRATALGAAAIEVLAPEAAKTPAPPGAGGPALLEARGESLLITLRRPEGRRAAVLEPKEGTTRIAPIPAAPLLRPFAAPLGGERGFLVLRDERGPWSKAPGRVEIWWVDAKGERAVRRFAGTAGPDESFDPLGPTSPDGLRAVVALETHDVQARRFLELGWLELTTGSFSRILSAPKPQGVPRSALPSFAGEVDVSVDGQRLALIYGGAALIWPASAADATIPASRR